MKKTVLVTGSNGLLGQKLTDIYLALNEVQFIATGKGVNRHPVKSGYIYLEMDVTKASQVDEIFEAYKPDCVIHTAAMTNVDACELDHEACILNNVDAVNNLVKSAAKTHTHLIHLSTDFIFDGKSGPYNEEAEAHPLSFYGESKLLAEQSVVKGSAPWSIARTVLVYGLVADMSRSNIVLWAKEALENKKNIKVVDDQYRTPTLAEDLAMGCRLIEKNQAEGIYNISGKDFLNIYELVERVASHFGLSMENVEKTNSLSLNQPAKRPPVTGFDITKAIRNLGYHPHSFDEGIDLIQSQFERFMKSKAT